MQIVPEGPSYFLLDDDDDDDEEEQQQQQNKENANLKKESKKKAKKKFGEKILTEAREAREAEAKLKEIDAKLSQIRDQTQAETDHHRRQFGHWRSSPAPDRDDPAGAAASTTPPPEPRLPTDVLRKLIDDAARDLRLVITPPSDHRQDGLTERWTVSDVGDQESKPAHSGAEQPRILA